MGGAPKPPKPLAPPPPPPTVDQAAQAADQADQLRRRRGAAATLFAGADTTASLTPRTAAATIYPSNPSGRLGV